ncbi:hypothetical protein ACH347_24455, partial [Saccharopolyspora sp. 5N102]|uniref:hypothetical protein n=1 Tax=Saccharopolyspora sp. 5N102 TaxID=3375155 RepID=UPI00379137EA
HRRNHPPPQILLRDRRKPLDINHRHLHTITNDHAIFELPINKSSLRSVIATPLHIAWSVRTPGRG